MPRHSKNSADRPFYSHAEKKTYGLNSGTESQRLGNDSQLPFGSCPLTLNPILEAVVTPSGHMYEREAILEYLLKRTKELKDQQKLYEDQQARKLVQATQTSETGKIKELQKFSDTQDGVNHVKRSLTSQEETSSHAVVRNRIIDSTSAETRKEQLKQVCPWIVQFTPSVDGEVEIMELPPKRPLSPYSGRPLRTKDLVPVTLTKEAPGSDKYICPVTRKTITNQKLVLLPTGTLMLESAAESLAYATQTCPLTGAQFNRDDVIEIAASASAFSSTGAVVAKKFKPSLN